MRCPTRSILTVLLVATGGAAAAEPETAASGFEAAVASGVIIPFGDAVKNTKLSDYAGFAVPIMGQAGYRFGGKYFLGASAFYGFAKLGDRYKTQCDASGVSCSVGGLHLGAEFQFHPMGRAAIDPWVGLGFGYEWTSTKVSDGTQSFTATLEGWDFLKLDGGVDFALGSLFRLGPFVGFMMGQFDKGTFSFQGQSVTSDIPNKALHYYFIVGLKLTIVP